jgi:hypothetical protein
MASRRPQRLHTVLRRRRSKQRCLLSLLSGLDAARACGDGACQQDDEQPGGRPAVHGLIVRYGLEFGHRLPSMMSRGAEVVRLLPKLLPRPWSLSTRDDRVDRPGISPRQVATPERFWTICPCLRI